MEAIIKLNLKFQELFTVCSAMGKVTSKVYINFDVVFQVESFHDSDYRGYDPRIGLPSTGVTTCPSYPEEDMHLIQTSSNHSR